MLQREPWCKSIDEIMKLTPGQVNVLVKYENHRNEQLAAEQHSMVGPGGAGGGRGGGGKQLGGHLAPIGRNSGRPVPQAATGPLKGLFFPPSGGPTQF